ncbi:hypothetical protein FPOA_05066 [Fusarium poae]|uniref:Uncharacterized protein n=1 Tax=Fusarium poae TaxID=36050 RepID=A0A1B8AVH5_FUSPO|nr:hypothetical protein FPOA_05066 [Fusarium poae]
MKGGRKVHKAFIRRGASWRKMLVAQPPITSVGYMHRVVNRTREWRLLSFPAGLRMGELYDMVFQAIWSKPDDVSGYAYIELELNGFLDDSIQDQSCGKGRCCGHTVYTLDSMCFRLREEKVDIRACKSTRWMFKREEFEERNYLGPDQPRFTIS